MEDVLAFDVDVEDDYTSGTYSLVVPSTCSPVCMALFRRSKRNVFFALYVPVNKAGVFWTALLNLNIIGEQRKMLERLAVAQTSMQELKYEVSRLCKAPMAAT